MTTTNSVKWSCTGWNSESTLAAMEWCAWVQKFAHPPPIVSKQRILQFRYRRHSNVKLGIICNRRTFWRNITYVYEWECLNFTTEGIQKVFRRQRFEEVMQAKGGRTGYERISNALLTYCIWPLFLHLWVMTLSKYVYGDSSFVVMDL